MKLYRLPTHRFTGAALLLAVLLLPFHFHFYSVASTVNKHCTCESGARTQLGAAQAVNDGTPILEALPLLRDLPRLVARVWVEPHHSRAPPSL